MRSNTALIVFSLSALVCTFLLACNSNTNEKNDSSSNKFKQYYVQGEQLYLKHCANCHQKNGTGLGRVYPPLNVSDYMQNNYEDVVCLIRHGKSGKLIVNGKDFNQTMPGVSNLTDLEVAQITTYIYNTWNNSRGITEVTEASKILNTCTSRN